MKNWMELIEQTTKKIEENTISPKEVKKVLEEYFQYINSDEYFLTLSDEQKELLNKEKVLENIFNIKNIRYAFSNGVMCIDGYTKGRAEIEIDENGKTKYISVNMWDTLDVIDTNANILISENLSDWGLHYKTSLTENELTPEYQEFIKSIEDFDADYDEIDGYDVEEIRSEDDIWIDEEYAPIILRCMKILAKELWNSKDFWDNNEVSSKTWFKRFKAIVNWFTQVFGNEEFANSLFYIQL